MPELKLPVTEIKDYMDNKRVAFKIITLSLEGKDFPFQTGQFVMLAMDTFKDRNKPEEPRWVAMSIASSHLDKDHIEFCIEIKDTLGFSNHLGKNLNVGDHLLVKGPMGHFILRDMDHDIVLIATGSGIAPIMGMIRTLAKSGYKKDFKLFFGFRYRNDYLYKEELEKYAKENHNFEFVPVCSRDPDWKGCRGHVQEHIESHNFKDPANTHAYLCGNPKMVMTTKDLLVKLGFKKENLFQEQWA